MALEKMIVGIVLLLIGLYTLAVNISDFIILLKGFIPPTLIVLGVIFIWIETEEMKIEKPKAVTQMPKKRKR